jgi:hypothetical protein
MPATAQIAIATVGIDIGKNSFHIVGLDDRGTWSSRAFAAGETQNPSVQSRRHNAQRSFQALLEPTKIVDMAASGIPKMFSCRVRAQLLGVALFTAIIFVSSNEMLAPQMQSPPSVSSPGKASSA